MQINSLSEELRELKEREEANRQDAEAKSYIYISAVDTLEKKLKTLEDKLCAKDEQMNAMEEKLNDTVRQLQQLMTNLMTSGMINNNTANVWSINNSIDTNSSND